MEAPTSDNSSLCQVDAKLASTQNKNVEKCSKQW